MVGLVPGGPGERAGLLPGDRLLAVNGLVPRDIIDVRLDSTAARVELDVERAGRGIVLAAEKDPDEDLGIEFATPAFDRMKTCNNRCDFCFIGGLPPGLRRSLYIKDDDFRYSFLYGNFTTLTNLSAAEWDRLLFQRLSPLHVSVHATDPDLRRELLANPKAPRILDQLDELGAHGIEAHAQVVLMPGRNDGAALEQTISDLAARHPRAVASAAVVPVGLTAHSSPRWTRAVEPLDAAAAIHAVERHQRELRRQFGRGFVYASDELYLLAGRPLPSARSYDDYPQLQNGVGLVRLFREGWRRAARRLPDRIDPPMAVGWATGTLVAPMLRELAADLAPVAGLTVEVAPVTNSLFGSQVSVAGLVPAAEIVSALRGRGWARLVLPRSMFDVDGALTIDGWSGQDVADALGLDVTIAGTPRELIEATISPLSECARGLTGVLAESTRGRSGASGESARGLAGGPGGEAPRGLGGRG